MNTNKNEYENAHKTDNTKIATRLLIRTPSIGNLKLHYFNCAFSRKSGDRSTQRSSVNTERLTLMLF